MLGCNDRVQLAALRAILRDRVNRAWSSTGVTIVDPATTWIDVTVAARPRRRDRAEHPPARRHHGRRRRGGRAGHHADRHRRSASGATVVRAHAVGAVIGPGASVGPYAYLRPGTVLRDGAKVGTFVEVKNAEVGAGTKVPHLSYVGDATIGEQTNIGAATVFVNYDGVAQAPHGDRQPRPDRGRQHVRRPGHGRRRRVHGGRQRDHHRRTAGRARRGPGPAAQHRGLGRAPPGRQQGGRGRRERDRRAGGGPQRSTAVTPSGTAPTASQRRERYCTASSQRPRRSTQGKRQCR